MKTKNLWETNLQKYYTFLNNIDDVIQAIKDGKLNLNFQTKVRFTPGNNVDNYLDQVANDKNIVLNYTDELHNIALTSNEILPIIINPVFFEKYKEQLKNAFIKNIIAINQGKILITDLVFTDELFEYLLTKKNIILHFSNISLTDEQIEKLKKNYIKAYLVTNSETIEISSNHAFKTYTLEDLKKTKHLEIKINELETENLENLCYLPDNAIISISSVDLINNPPILEESKLNLIKQKLLELDNLNKSFTFKITVERRSNFNKVFKDTNFKNLTLIINNDSYDYPLEEYFKEEEKLNRLVEHIKNASLSPLEKYLAVYNVVKNFKPYKENHNDFTSSRYLRYILDNEYIVCVGFAKLLVELLDKVGINALDISVNTDISYDRGFTLEEKVVELAGHARVIVNIDDDKYNIHGLYIADPTWDKKNLLNHSLMTFDKMQTSSSMFYYNYYRPILDIHNFQEFNSQINFLLKRKTKELQNSSQKPFREILLETYQLTSLNILEALSCDPKYQEFKLLHYSCQTEKDYEIFFTKLGNYLLTRINKPISNEMILNASIEGIKKTNPNLSENEIINIKNTTKEDNDRNKELESFPYQIPENNDFDLEHVKHR